MILINSYRFAAAGYTPVYAPAFITATGISDPTIEAALEALEIDLNDFALLPLIYALYPMAGGTATTHKYNFMDAQDTDAAFRITWNGGVTHSASGINGSGTSYGDTHLVPDTHLSKNNKGYTVSLNTSATGGGNIGCANVNNSTFDGIFVANGAFYGYASDLNGSTEANSNSIGIWIVNRLNGTEINFYKDGAAFGTNPHSNSSTSGQNTAVVHVLEANSQYSTARMDFAVIHQGLDATQSANLTTCIDTFNTALSR